MDRPITFHTAWLKSSFSAEDSDCVEVAFGTWRKSAFSGASNCVELALGEEIAGVRDSKNPAAGHLTVQSVTYQGLLAFAKHA